jgi:hypothetical protein
MSYEMHVLSRIAARQDSLGKRILVQDILTALPAAALGSLERRTSVVFAAKYLEKKNVGKTLL